MHFPSLTQLGWNYNFEEGDAGHRTHEFNHGAATLVQKRYELGQARLLASGKSATVDKQPVAGPLKVSDRIAFFSGGAGQAKQAEAEAKVRKLEAEISALQLKLSREGARFNADGSIDWGASAAVVVYDRSAAAQDMTRLHFAGGRIFTDPARLTPFDTSDMVTHFGGAGWAIYVMSPTGNIHVSSHSVGNRHHSSLLAGGNVAGAGEMRVLRGKLVQISNKSGHYAPNAGHLLQVLYLLQKRGVDLNGVRVTYRTRTEGAEYPNVAAFLADLPGKGIEPDFEYAKLIAYCESVPYAQFHALVAPRGWRWVDGPEYAAGGRGVVTTTGVPVPHREVRKYLKSLPPGTAAMNVKLQSGMSR